MAIFSFSLLLFLQPVREINFIGNETFPKERLQQLITTRPGSTLSRAMIDHDRAVLIDYYRKQGFFGTNIIATITGDTAVSIGFEIEEGKRPGIYRIYYPPDSEAILINTKLRAGDYLIEEEILKDIARVEDYLADRGYPFARLSYYPIFEHETLHFFWDLKKGKRYHIRKITITGLKNVPERLVRHSLLIRPGDLFSQRKIAESQKNLYLLFLFRLVEFRYEPAADSLDLVIRLEEGSPYGINLGFGFMTPSRLIGSITFENLNLIHTGNQLLIPIIGWINLKKEYSIRTSLGFKLLYPLDLPFSLTIGPFLEREHHLTYLRQGVGIQGMVKRGFGPGLEAGLTYQYRRLRWEGIPLREGITNSITGKAILDWRDEILDPKRGVFLLPTLALGGTFLGGDNHFLRGLLDLRVYLPLPGFTYAWRFRIGEIFPLHRGFETHEEFQLVASSALRGYHDYEIGPDSIGSEHYGSFLFGIQSEPRFRIGRFGLVLFLDLAGLEKGYREFDIEDLEIGTGFGLRYFTPLGPIRLDWGKRMKGAPPKDYGLIYLSLQHAF
ncbi:hypothetical protein DRP53_03575 [candidate division WOR-3 bacterium]|uniref:POTRA domain-containing protein n=1 Tax=candidate division WOR-3 bacterium TaxID=2052148 RepID=A0A660SJ72_UNCW3|nr:MAG: hypothetical protein DRP53_03575 [candidate division WOR-3 bacterium]